jgi:parallel beta-helix repeat protein
VCGVQRLNSLRAIGIILLALGTGINVYTHAAFIESSGAAYQPHSSIVIITNAGFTSKNGVTSGTGTPSDPYIISGWDINALTVNGITVFNSTAYFNIRNVHIHSGVRGIYLSNDTNAVVQNSVLSNNTIGIIAQNSPQVIISGNMVSNSEKGILLISSPGALVLGNNAFSKLSTLTSDFDYGILITSSNAVKVQNNNVSVTSVPQSRTISALGLNYSANVQVFNNHLSSSIGVGLSSVSSPGGNIQGNTISNSLGGVSSFGSPNTNIQANNVTGNSGAGISSSSDNTTIAGNIISFNQGSGLQVSVDYPIKKGTAIRGNIFTWNGLVISNLFGASIANFSSLTITPDNLVNGKPLYFYKDCMNLSLDGVSVGQLILANCKNVLIRHLQITSTDIGMQLLNVDGALVTSNTIMSNGEFGVILWPPGSSALSNITVVDNNISNNGWLNSAWLGIESGGPNVRVYHNNLIYNTARDWVIQGNSWHNGYPSGGNFWSAYTGVDNCSGPNQDICPSPDGVGDTPYSLVRACCGTAVDRYPLIRPRLTAPDTTAPSWPARSPLTAYSIQPTTLTLLWLPASDDVGVVSYRVYRGTTIIGTVPADQRSYTVTGLSPGDTYTFSVEAVDWAGNQSGGGPSASFSTPGQTPTFPPSWVQYLLPLLVVTGATASLSVLFFLRRKKNAAKIAVSGPLEKPN